jgi:hypothetical protein
VLLLSALTVGGSLPAATVVPAEMVDGPRVATSDEAPAPGPADIARVSIDTPAVGGGSLGPGCTAPSPPVMPCAHLRSTPSGVGSPWVGSLPPVTPARPRAPPAAVG